MQRGELVVVGDDRPMVLAVPPSGEAWVVLSALHRSFWEHGPAQVCAADDALQDFADLVSPGGPIDFGALADALLQRSRLLVPQWLPGGVERNGRWYVGRLRRWRGRKRQRQPGHGHLDRQRGAGRGQGRRPDQFARIRGLNNGQAARELMRELGWTRAQAAPSPAARSAPRQVQTPAGDGAPPPDDCPDEAAPEGGPRRSVWRALVPVPATRRRRCSSGLS